MGEVYPGRITRLGESRFALGRDHPGSLAAILLTSAGQTWVRWLLLDRCASAADTWGLHLPQLF